MAVYYLKSENGLVKIGHSSDFRTRARALQSSSPIPLTLVAVEPGGADKEKLRHLEFSDCKVKGEWFRPNIGLEVLIELLPTRYPVGTYCDGDAPVWGLSDEIEWTREEVEDIERDITDLEKDLRDKRKDLEEARYKLAKLTGRK